MDEVARTARICAELRTKLHDREIHYRQSSDPALAMIAPPLATENEIYETERALGFSLPPFLRSFYLGVVNRSFAHAIDSLDYYSGGGCRAIHDEQSVAHTLSRSGWQIHQHIVEALSRRQDIYVFSDERPDGFITLGADVSHLASIELDLRTGKVFLVENAGADTLPGADGEDIYLMKIFFGAASLQEWFERWIEEGEFYQIYPRFQLRAEDIDVGNNSDVAEIWYGLYRVEPLREDDVEDFNDGV